MKYFYSYSIIGKAPHDWETTTPQSSWKKTTTKKGWTVKTTKSNWKGIYIFIVSIRDYLLAEIKIF